MVTLTPEQFDHAIRVITGLCLVMDMLGALLMQGLQSMFIGLCTKVIYFKAPLCRGPQNNGSQKLSDKPPKLAPNTR